MLPYISVARCLVAAKISRARDWRHENASTTQINLGFVFASIADFAQRFEAMGAFF
jgi:hypothetical protein